MNRIRVLEMIDQPFLGGGQINLLSLARGLDPERFDVTVCTRPQGPLVEELRTANVKCLAVPFRKTLRLSLLREVESLLRRNRFDLLHTHGGVAGLYGRWAAARAGGPRCIHTLHGIHYLHYPNPILKHLHIQQERWLSRRTGAVILVSEADLRAAERYNLVPRNRRILIRNGIDFEGLRSGRAQGKDKASVCEELGLSPDSPLIGTVSRLHRQKGIPYLIRSVRILADEVPSLKVLIVGDGPQRAMLEHLISELKLGSHVLLLGERKDVPRLVSAWDLFVLASLWEGLPYALLEAAALAKPVVASDIAGVREIVEKDVSGKLVSPAQPQALAAAVSGLLKRPDQAAEMGRRLMEGARRTYDRDIMIKDTAALYKKVFSSSQAP